MEVCLENVHINTVCVLAVFLIWEARKVRKRGQCVCVRSLVSLLLLFLFKNIPGQECELAGCEACVFGKGTLS